MNVIVKYEFWKGDIAYVISPDIYPTLAASRDILWPVEGKKNIFPSLHVIVINTYNIISLFQHIQYNTFPYLVWKASQEHGYW